MDEKTCRFCGCTLTEHNNVIFDGVSMCLDCFDEKTVSCECCDERIWSYENAGDSNTVLCTKCYEADYTHCDHCGCVVHYDNVYYMNDNRYCSRCYDSLDSQAIYTYNYKPEPVFYGDGPLYMGVELEIDYGGECDENAEAICDIANSCHKHLYCKHDGSINEGFEMVSHPMTLRYHMCTMPWEHIFSKALDMDYRSHQTSTCGLHIHVNRSFFGNTYASQEEAIGRVVYFVENHWNELLKFSRRTEANINRWASRYGISTTAKDTYNNAKCNCSGRYVAVNLENENTVEFRMFRGTLRYESFIATLQLVEEICKTAILLSDHEIERLTWCDFVGKIDESKRELINYLKAKRLFVNEICNTETEEE